MTLSSKQVTSGLAVVVVGLLLSQFLAKDAAVPILVTAFLGLIAVVFAGGGAPSASLQGIAEATRLAASGEKPAIPPEASGEAMRVYEALASLAEQRRKDQGELGARREEVAEYERALEEIARRLDANVNTQVSAANETSRLIRELTGAVTEIATHLEALTQSAEESSSSILEMTATNDEVAENVGELAGSVRETVSSIEEMAYSIKEVAKNLSLIHI